MTRVRLRTAIAAATRRGVAGVSTETDHVDGSNLVLAITPGLRVTLFDDVATVCGGAPAIATGRATLSGDDVVIDDFTRRNRSRHLYPTALTRLVRPPVEVGPR